MLDMVLFFGLEDVLAIKLLEHFITSAGSGGS